MLLGFISLLLTVAQNVVSHICVPEDAASIMLPCKQEEIINQSSEIITPWEWNGRRRLFAEVDKGPRHCAIKGKVPLLSLEALHHLHIFIFVLAVVHVVFCVSTMLLGGARVSFPDQFKEISKQNFSFFIISSPHCSIHVYR